MSAPSIPTLLVSHWRWAPGLDISAAAVLTAYVHGAHRQRHRWPLRRTLSFAAGICSVLLATQSGVDSFGDRLLSAHMAQHMVLLLLAPLLLLGGQPLLLVLRSTAPVQRRRLIAILRATAPLLHPLACAGTFAAVLLIAHVPSVYDMTLRSPALHDAEHCAFLLAGALMWWPLIGVDPLGAHRLGPIARLGYLFAAMLPMAVIGAYLNRDPSELYREYAAPAQGLGISPLGDQALAGVIMWVVGTLLMAAIGLRTTIDALLTEERRVAAAERRTALAHAPGAPR
jgi:cytochrome c oxidase assembly factor CtaG